VKKVNGSDLHEYLNLFHPISGNDFELLTQNLKTKEFKKGDSIIVPGEIQKELYFIKSGIQMSYFETEEKKHVLAFTYPPNLCAIPESFSYQTASGYYLTCLSDSSMECLSFERLQVLFDKSQAIERLFRKMTEAILAGLINRHIELHALSMEERYKIFCSRSPQLLNTVPHKYIASYLGMDPTNFSKLYNNVMF
jgi:CRP-like cAMP-binding protein